MSGMTSRLLSRSGLLRHLASSNADFCRGFASQSGSSVYVIFGATGGIGADLAKRLLASKSTVILAADQGDKLSKLKEELGGGETKEVDVMNSKQIVDFLDGVAEEHGEITGVTNLIGNMCIKPAHLTSDEEFNTALQANTWSSFNILKGAAKAMMKNKKGGSIVLTSASVAHTGVANHDAIAAAKGAVAGLTTGASATYAPHNIRINCIAPGLVQTGMTESIWKNESHKEASEDLHPMGRVGEPKDIARVVQFLLHPDSDFITGQIWGVDGGMTNVQAKQ
ncbi:hypothetical protein WJX79_009774 [Trebouxia sp. C0005]